MKLNQQYAARCVSRLERYLFGLGLESEMVDDLSRAKGVLNEMGALSHNSDAKGPYVTKILDPYSNTLSSATSFWLFLYDKSGTPVSKTATRYDDIGTDTFAAWASRAVYSYHPGNNAVIPPNRFPSEAQEISGRITYCGDTYISPAHRSPALAKIFIDLNYALMYLKWGVPDWTTCYLRHADYLRWRSSWTNWKWSENASDFSQPPDSECRGLVFGHMDRRAFAEKIIGLQSQSYPLGSEEPPRIVDDLGLSSEPAQLVRYS